MMHNAPNSDARAALSTELMLEFERRAGEHERRATEMAEALEAARADALALAGEVERLEQHVGALNEERAQLQVQLENAQASSSSESSASESSASSEASATTAQPAPQLDEEERAALRPRP